MKVYHDNDTIYFSKEGIDKLGYTNYTPELWNIVSKTKWTVKKDKKDNPKYIYSNQLKKSLHQVVIDNFFTEQMRLDVYSKNYIIEHLDNNGFNCRITNLYFLKKVTNTYKGWYFDKVSKKSIPVVSMRMFHIIETRRFQITMGFNYPFTNQESNKELYAVKLLYDKPYKIVFQDAEVLLDYILDNRKFNINELRELLRFKDIRIQEYEHIQLSEKSPKLQGGSCVMIDGKAYIVQGFDDKMRIISVNYDKDWE